MIGSPPGRTRGTLRFEERLRKRRAAGEFSFKISKKGGKMGTKSRFPQLTSPTHSDLRALAIAYDLAPILVAEYAMVDVGL